MYVGIALGAVVVVAFVAICILIAVIRKKKRAAVHDVPYTPRPREAGEVFVAFFCLLSCFVPRTSFLMISAIRC